MTQALHLVGERVAAGRWFERNRAACGPAGLYTEEYDVHQRQLRGNLPQAFVHAALLECAVTLAADRDPDEVNRATGLAKQRRCLVRACGAHCSP